MKRRDHRLLVATASMATAGVLAFALPATAVGPAPTSAAAAVPVLAWQPCADPSQNGFDCATAEVPLNYQNPEGSTIELALVRHSATDPPGASAPSSSTQAAQAAPAPSHCPPGSNSFQPRCVRALT